MERHVPICPIDLSWKVLVWNRKGSVEFVSSIGQNGLDAVWRGVSIEVTRREQFRLVLVEWEGRDATRYVLWNGMVWCALSNRTETSRTVQKIGLGMSWQVTEMNRFDWNRLEDRMWKGVSHRTE